MRKKTLEMDKHIETTASNKAKNYDLSKACIPDFKILTRFSSAKNC